MRTLGPFVTFLIVVVIGVAAGLLYDRFAGPGWIGRRLAGTRRGPATAALVGVAGSFVGFHLAGLLDLSAGGAGLYVGAIIGTVVILWLWGMSR
jgi:uncharacterized membrane protein YeaQ/YmgE (transglycosylase-associated protein family)